MSFIKKHFRSTTKFHSRPHEGVIFGLIPQTKRQSPQEITNTTNRQFLSKFWMSSPPAETFLESELTNHTFPNIPAFESAA